MSEAPNAKRAFGVDLAMNCATTNVFFVNERRSNRNGISLLFPKMQCNGRARWKAVFRQSG